MGELSVNESKSGGRAMQEPERSLSEIASELWTHSEVLVRQEIQLARAQLGERAQALKNELKVAATAAALLYVGVLSLTTAVILLLCKWLEPWLAALIVGVTMSGLGYVLGRREPERLASAVTHGDAEPAAQHGHSVGQARR